MCGLFKCHGKSVVRTEMNSERTASKAVGAQDIPALLSQLLGLIFDHNYYIFLELP